MVTKAGSKEGALSVKAGRLEILAVDKSMTPSTSMTPALARRLAELNAVEKRGDRVLNLTETPIGQLLYAMAAVSGGPAAAEINVAVGEKTHRIAAPDGDQQQYDRARVDVTRDGWVLVSDTFRKLVLELHPERGERRVVCRVPIEDRGTIEAARLRDAIAISTTDGVFLMNDPQSGTLDAFVPLKGFKHITPTTDGRGLVVCIIDSLAGASVAVVDVSHGRLRVVHQLKTAKPLTDPRIHEGRVIARQGNAWVEIRGIELPQAAPGDAVAELTNEAEKRLAAGSAALMPVADRTLPRRPNRQHDGQNVVAALATNAGEVLIVEAGVRNDLLVQPKGGSSIAIETDFVQFPESLDASPDGRRVLVSGNTGGGFPVRDVDLATGEQRHFLEEFSSEAWTAVCYLTNDRIVSAYSNSLTVYSTEGEELESVDLESVSDVNAMAVNRSRDLLLRTNNGNLAFVRTTGSEIESQELIPTRAGSIAADGDEFLAMVDGVTCKLVTP